MLRKDKYVYILEICNIKQNKVESMGRMIPSACLGLYQQLGKDG